MALIGIAYSGYVAELVESCPGRLDFVEVPFELLRHNPRALEPLKGLRVILHCASLNIAGPVRPGADVVDCLRGWVGVTRTPWVGEHLAFTTAAPDGATRGAEGHEPGEPYNLGFTMSPPMNDETVRGVVEVADRYGRELGVPLALENSPLYFDTPGNSMGQVDFVREICRSSDVRLLLDLTHFLITSRNMGFDAFRELERYPLDRVDEIHLSGASDQCGVWWDDHACPAPDEVFELLSLATRGATPRAITIEYNWSVKFPLDTLLTDLERTRKVIGRG